MMDRLSNPAKIKAFGLAEELKTIMRPLFWKHMDDIMSGEFSSTMMKDWANDDVNLLTWRKATGETAFEKTPAGSMEISEQEYYDNGVLMVAMVKAGVELAFETMTEAGIKEESAYYESLHETPLIGKTYGAGKGNGVDNQLLIAVNEELRFHPIEIVGAELRQAMTAMKKIVG
jgi:ketol-acid reductoisomerase